MGHSKGDAVLFHLKPLAAARAGEIAGKPYRKDGRTVVDVRARDDRAGRMYTLAVPLHHVEDMDAPAQPAPTQLFEVYLAGFPAQYMGEAQAVSFEAACDQVFRGIRAYDRGTLAHDMVYLTSKPGGDPAYWTSPRNPDRAVDGAQWSGEARAFARLRPSAQPESYAF